MPHRRKNLSEKLEMTKEGKFYSSMNFKETCLKCWEFMGSDCLKHNYSGHVHIEIGVQLSPEAYKIVELYTIRTMMPKCSPQIYPIKFLPLVPLLSALTLDLTVLSNVLFCGRIL